MPSVTSEVRIETASNAPSPVSAPSATGGDELGTWVYTKVTLYLPPAADGQVNTQSSKIEGTGFVAFEGGRFRQLSEMTTTISTNVIGTVIRQATTTTKGTYTQSGGALVFTPGADCPPPASTEVTISDFGFSRVSDDAARLHFTSTSTTGAARLVIDMKRVP
jgi:hypothetical protein